MTWLEALLGSAAAIVAAALFHKKLTEQNASMPEQWPETLDRSSTTRYLKAYLRATGWRILEGWLWADIEVRAHKGDLDLNVYVEDERSLSLRTRMFDVLEYSRSIKAPIGILTRQFISDDLRCEAARLGLYIFQPSDLVQIETTARVARELHNSWNAQMENDGHPTNKIIITSVQPLSEVLRP